MGLKIPLVEVSKQKYKHPYPFQIAIQAIEFLHVSIFHPIFTSIATAEYVKIEGNFDEIKDKFSEGLGSEDFYEEGFKYLKKYLNVFEKINSQHVLIALNSHWDWYIRNLANFIIYARNYDVTKSLVLTMGKTLYSFATSPNPDAYVNALTYAIEHKNIDKYYIVVISEHEYKNEDESKYWASTINANISTQLQALSNGKYYKYREQEYEGLKNKEDIDI